MNSGTPRNTPTTRDTSDKPRSSRRGFALLLVIASTLLISGLFLTLRTQVYSAVSVMSRIQSTHEATLIRWSIVEEVRANPSTYYNRGNANLQRQGRLWEVRVSDVEGLVDLYLSPPDVLNFSGISGASVASLRERVLAEMPMGQRFASEVQTLARYGFDEAERARLTPLVTQRARTGDINLRLAPGEILARLNASYRGDIAGGDLAEISVRERR